MKRYIFTGLLTTLYSLSFAQKPGWQHLDLQKNSVFGISTDRAYNELLKGKKSQTVIVGIVDCGVDTLQEDLRSLIWTDRKTDHHGWNYIGGESGQEDITRLVGRNGKLYDSLADNMITVPEVYRKGYQAHRQLLPALQGKINTMKNLAANLKAAREMADIIVRRIGKENPTEADFKAYPPKEASLNDTLLYSGSGVPFEKQLIKEITKRLHLYKNWQEYRHFEIDNIIQLAEFHLGHGLNLENTEADTAKGNFDISPDKLGPVQPDLVAYHGTHVAGIIGAVRNNGIGMDGIADNVKILMLKENGTLREMRDDALAKAIRYAVDHGAKVINLSFGKPYTWNKKVVDDAVKYAMKKDVLLVHAAGNNGANLDTEEHYPNPVYADKSGKAQAWLEVGASGPKNNAFLEADFSNYGKRDVDVFAPGVQIYSTLPYNQYQSWDGTSMATPVVAGLAALIREYYPKLSAVQVKDIIMKTVTKSDYLTGRCVSGGVVNAYSALKIAGTY